MLNYILSLCDFSFQKQSLHHHGVCGEKKSPSRMNSLKKGEKTRWAGDKNNNRNETGAWLHKCLFSLFKGWNQLQIWMKGSLVRKGYIGQKKRGIPLFCHPHHIKTCLLVMVLQLTLGITNIHARTWFHFIACMICWNQIWCEWDKLCVCVGGGNQKTGIISNYTKKHAD